MTPRSACHELFGYLSSSDSHLVEQLVAQWKTR
jgi:hypothetical protein